MELKSARSAQQAPGGASSLTKFLSIVVPQPLKKRQGIRPNRLIQQRYGQPGLVGSARLHGLRVREMATSHDEGNVCLNTPGLIVCGEQPWRGVVGNELDFTVMALQDKRGFTTGSTVVKNQE